MTKAKRNAFITRAMVYVGADFTGIVFLGLVLYILIRGILNLNRNLFAWEYNTGNASMMPAMINTVSMTFLSLLIAAPIGVYGAIYMTEYAASASPLVRVVRITSETLTGIPSILYGLFGLMFFVTSLKLGLSLASGALTLSIMILPLILSATEEALIAVPREYREGSFGLGAGRLRTVSKVVLPSAAGDILSINESAAVIFGVDPKAFVGRPILSINRSVALESVVERASRGESAEAELRMGDRHYQLIGNPVNPGDKAQGIVILALDITDRESAERSRREFTANVSHELKTPLTSITGYAEIMKNGTARPEDMQDFAARIHDEATRLAALIEDVMRLSRLDEMDRMPEKARVDLLALSEAVVRRLLPQAERREVTLSASGERLLILGYEKILEEMVYNLCDNAIKYNVNGGSVEAIVREEAGRVTLAVSDTGIGIPPEHQARVFERFYRIDHSHARETGGTGLGLSIVKHSAAVHGATVSLTSQVGKGTRIVISFPAGIEKPQGV